MFLLSGIVNMAKKIKEVHPDYVAIFKVGSFYHTYGKDSYVIAGLFDYVIKPSGDTITCGFGLSAINKVKKKLEDEKINFIILDPRNNYDVDEKSDNKNLNKYNDVLNKCYSKNKRKNQIKKISERLEMFIEREDFKQIIRKIEDVIDDEI